MSTLTLESPTLLPSSSRGYPRLAGGSVVHRTKVLVADDDVSMLRLASHTLERAGIEVQTAGDGYAAVEKALRSRPDVLLLDVNMPAGNGFTVQERYEQAVRYQDARVVYMSGDDDDRLRDLVSRYTTTPLLLKPFSPEKLVDVVLSIEEDEPYLLAA